MQQQDAEAATDRDRSTSLASHASSPSPTPSGRFHTVVAEARASSLQHAGARRPRKHNKRVRFEGIASPAKLWWALVLAGHFRPGCRTASRWEAFVGLAAAANCFITPLHLVVGSLERIKAGLGGGGAQRGLESLEKTQLVIFLVEIMVEAAFVLDIAFRVAQAMVMDLGLQESAVDKLLDISEAQQGSGQAEQGPGDAAALASRAVMQDVPMIGHHTRRALMLSCPVRVALSLPSWMARYLLNSELWEVIGDSCRVYRLVDLMKYFGKRQEDIAIDIRWLAFFKFCFIIFATSHWCARPSDLA